MEAPVYVAVTINDNYYRPLKVMLYSLLTNNRNSSFTIILCHSSVSGENIADLKEWLEAMHAELMEVRVEDSLFEGIESVEHVTRETFYRLLLPHILPDKIKRVLYLDPDLIIQGDISRICQMDMRGRSIIAAGVARDNARWNDQKRRIRIPLHAKYFNAGMCVMDLEKLRADPHFRPEYIMRFMKDNYKYILEGDQAYLNKFLWNKAIVLNCCKYNFDTRSRCGSVGSIREKAVLKQKERAYARAAARKAVIIHYRGGRKPWTDEFDGYLGEIYRRYERETALSQQKVLVRR